MLIHDSCQSAIQSCLDTKTFAVARLYNDEKTMSIHVHNCYEVYYSISGGKQFLIDNRVYEFKPGDIFYINQFESHHLSKIDQMTHERVVLSIYPEYLKQFSTDQTNLDYCFTCRNTVFGHRISLKEDEQKQFMYFIHKFSEDRNFGQDILDQAIFLQMMTFLNSVFVSRSVQEPNLSQNKSKAFPRRNHTQIDEILSYINQHLSENLSIPMLAAHFYLSTSYLCKMFKKTTGTTIYRYITAKRISRAKALLAEGHPVAETSNLCGFGDYSNFLKSFTKVVGMSPREYATLSRK